MIELIKEVTKTAQETSERAFRLFFEMLAMASERIRNLNDRTPTPDPGQSSWVPPATAATPAPLANEAAAVRSTPTGFPTREVVSAAEHDDAKIRNDQMIRVLELLLAAGTRWQSAKELSDAGKRAGTPILPGNVRKVIRARAGEHIETRPREGSRRGAMEYRITEEGRTYLADVLKS
jgi:hypothetical protein